MKRGVLIAIIVIVLAAAIGFGLAANNNNKNSTNNTNTSPTNTNQNTSNNQNNSNTPSSSNSVTIQNMAFTPADITVKKGTTVTWTNQDSVTHTVQETDSQKGPNSENLENGEKYSFTFDETGTFHYHCSIHPDMTGTVTVTE
jgi:plastocyanin